MPSRHTPRDAAELALSGPHVWPSLSAEATADRFIHRRPEIAYLRALADLREAHAEGSAPPEEDWLQVRIRRVQKMGPRGQRSISQTGKFKHSPTDGTDAEEDVRLFLRVLRTLLHRGMPRAPTLGCSVMIEFFLPGEPRIATRVFQDEWL